MFKDKLLQSKPGIITYGITPPKQSHTLEKIKEIAEKHLERFQNMAVDGLIIYDIQDEAERTSTERPFPFLPTIDPGVYAEQYLNQLNMPKIIYRCIGKYSENQLTEWLSSNKQEDTYSVFVGAASRDQPVMMKLKEAYTLSQRINPQLILGGVTIPERHLKNNDEHLRIIHKIENGCRFFVSQAVYNIEASKNFLSDYYYYCQENNLSMVPILFTLTPCGSQKTLEFMKWLGINIPKWLENELIHSEDILDKSIELLTKQFQELLEFASDKKIPIGCNIESVSVRKVEIEASVLLVEIIRAMLGEN